MGDLRARRRHERPTVRVRRSSASPSRSHAPRFSFCLSSLLRLLAPARRINWTGAALTTFYAAVRKALVVVLVLRAIGVLVSVTVGLWWVFR